MKHKPIPKLSESTLKQIWGKIKICSNDSCWEWEGYKRSGYGRYNQYNVTRIIYYLINKIDPGKLCVLHRCDNPSCCNPKHLWLGTLLENIVDRTQKGRSNHPKGVKNGRAKLTEKDIKKIRKSKKRNCILAKQYKVTNANISDIRKRKIWKHVK